MGVFGLIFLTQCLKIFNNVHTHANVHIYVLHVHISIWKIKINNDCVFLLEIINVCLCGCPLKKIFGFASIELNLGLVKMMISLDVYVASSNILNMMRLLYMLYDV